MKFKIYDLYGDVAMYVVEYNFDKKFMSKRSLFGELIHFL